MYYTVTHSIIPNNNCVKLRADGEYNALVFRSLQEVLTLIDELKEKAITAWPEDWDLHVAGLNDD